MICRKKLCELVEVVGEDKIKSEMSLKEVLKMKAEIEKLIEDRNIHAIELFEGNKIQDKEDRIHYMIEKFETFIGKW